MTIKELIEKLEQHPPDTEVWTYDEENRFYSEFFDVEFIKDGGFDFDKPLKPGDYEKIDIIGLR